jgi:predicted transcriptional regulator of viral defense system
VRLVQLAQQGDVERVSRGVYRYARFPVSRLGHYMEAVLWPQVRRPEVVGVVSHQSALALHELSDVSPARVHVTLPTTVRIRRALPKGLVLHYADLALEDVERVEGVPVTTPARSIRDVHASHLGNDLVAQAIADGRRSGALSMAVANRLQRELLGSTPSSGPAVRARLGAR